MRRCARLPDITTPGLLAPAWVWRAVAHGDDQCDRKNEFEPRCAGTGAYEVDVDGRSSLTLCAADTVDLRDTMSRIAAGSAIRAIRTATR